MVVMMSGEGKPMGTDTESGAAGREFWRGVLAAGGVTTIPRWTLEPVTGVAGYELTLELELVGAVRRLAGELGVAPRTVLLAAHTKVLIALSGEKDVVTGYVAEPGGPVLPCRLSTELGSWRELLADVGRAEAAVLEHRDVPLDALRTELDLPGPAFETVFDPTGGSGELSGGQLLRVEMSEHSSVLRLRYRTDVIDHDCATRIAGYHRVALELITADPNADHGRQSLLSGAELEYQIDGMAGPHLDLGDKRFHELFEERVRRHPDAVAGVHGGTEWTYAELNSRANQLGRALLARGLTREGVVAVVTERNLDWMASVIAIFKAGGAYLPIEPHFPADRIATTFKRAETGWLLTERESTATLDVALETLPGLEKTYVDVAYGEGHDGSDLGIEVTEDQLAYMYFTSGSTGTPKGAMCEQLGMLNHLWAKINDLGLGEGQVMTEIAPQCFDISLWQLVAALLQGGRTVIIEQDVILDVTRFVDKIVDQKVNVMQVVPSYLEVVCSYLEQFPRELPDLHCVSTTGEALKYELVQRWFALQPGIKVANAYGLTETSDDTNHEVMDRVPPGGRVPLGPPVNNVWIYVMDEHLVPVPLGAPGEIVFSGICVGRGYINDPDRTAAAFQADPLRSGERIYRSGDHGRWSPDGKLEFLGRKDTQVKIRGFRIEIGEIDNKLLKVSGVRDGAVVVGERADNTKHLVAFYSAEKPLDVQVLSETLAISLPEYMVPSAFHWRETLPLTANGKVDTKTLTKLAGELLEASNEGDYDAPQTPTEIRLAEAFAKVLKVPVDQVSRTDDFFDRGSSLSAVQLAVTLKRAVSLREITRTPVLADLAVLLDSKTNGGAVTKRAGLLQPLAVPDGTAKAALVCFPYAGGNAVNFQPMAKAIASGRRDDGLAVYAVELPGHDLTAERESFVPLDKVVEQVVAEIVGSGLAPLLLWGHSAGTALALEAARQLLARGVSVQRVFVGAQLLGSAEARRARIAELNGRSDAEIARGLSGDSGYTELGQLDAQRAEHVGAAYRHDYLGANGYFADAIEEPPADRLSAPVTVVIAADDPSVPTFRESYRDWGLLAEHVELHEIAEGGHYFLRTHPGDAAKAVLATELR
jgi:amino acid adenylation domain-containing protein